MHNINEWVLWIEEMISRDELFWCLNNFSQQQTMICMDWFCIDFVTFKTHVCNLEQALLLDGLHGTQWQNRHWVHTTLPSQVHKDKEFICCKFNIIAPALPAVYRVTITCCFNCITKRTSEINNTRYVCYWKVQSTLYSVHVLSLIKVNRQSVPAVLSEGGSSSSLEDNCSIAWDSTATNPSLKSSNVTYINNKIWSRAEESIHVPWVRDVSSEGWHDRRPINERHEPWENMSHLSLRTCKFKHARKPLALRIRTTM